ncbi:ribosome small subunit-dependent GTPase A [Peptostreptococcus equinus]|uniref:Small ribosomal subunit biogenesis GTPase RsgA n=1 Tax=Peptostreptococcus equinus TaxID=3003601 RepID=A0ABY7JRB3_9FIRM|nr:ribosome small subunit-dependent GTPase A [Peptostreptococcus sp. CBA3647]WAW14227.1 ribosome small subunit-dependent GTPase A [Peptostreptococcus sp. CBA3647]
MLEGIIIKGISSFYYVKVADKIYECKARGLFRKNKITPLVGDKVKITVLDTVELKGVIDEIYPRTSELVRPPIANIEKVMITFAIKAPKPNLTLLDKFIIFSEMENLEIIIVLTKTDLDDNDIRKNIEEEFTNIGYKVISVSAQTGENINKLLNELEDSISVFAGQSGVGKSSILNAIEPKFNLKTAEISQKLGRGKHTTRHAQLYTIGKNAIVADTPGFSSLDITEVDPDLLKEYFIEFRNFDNCRFGNKCIHKNEPECAVKEAVKEGKISKRRYDSYIQILDEIIKSKERYRRK